jgi:hypothetical protein
VWGGASGYTYTFGRSSDGATDVNVVIVRQGKNASGRPRHDNGAPGAHPGAARNQHCGMFRAKAGIAFAPVPS